MYSLGIVQWNFTRRDHPGNRGGVSGLGLVNISLHIQFGYEENFVLHMFFYKNLPKG